MVELGSPLTPELAERFEAEAAPRVRALFEPRLLEAAAPVDDGAAVHLGCRTGFHDEGLLQAVGALSLVGVDASAEALAVAERSQGALEGYLSYVCAPSLPTSLPPESFSHVISLYSVTMLAGEWRSLAVEAARLLQPGGQLLLALPLRGAFQEHLDLLRDFAAASDLDPGLVSALGAGLPTIEQATEALEDVGFSEVDLSRHKMSLGYESGGELLLDPLAWMVFEPCLGAALAEHGPHAVDYLRRAVERYWSELPIDLSLNVGCVSALR